MDNVKFVTVVLASEKGRKGTDAPSVGIGPDGMCRKADVWDQCCALLSVRICI